jgi:hypothetical protein
MPLTSPEEQRTDKAGRRIGTPSVRPWRVFTQLRAERIYKGSYYEDVPNPQYHEPICFQDGKFYWLATKEEIPQELLAERFPYILKQLSDNPIGEWRPARGVTIRDTEIDTLPEKMAAARESAPIIAPAVKRGRGRPRKNPTAAVLPTVA